MKKLNKILIAVLIILLPTKVFACPHVDEEGNLHFQFYNEEYTEMTMMYPKDGYLYDKNVLLDTLELLDEDFGFPLVQDKETYKYNYFIIDERLQKDDWESVDVKTTVEGIDEMLVAGIGYNLKVGLTNTFNDSMQYKDEKMLQMYYNIYVDRINDDENSEEYNNINNTIEKNNLELINPIMLNIKTDYFIMDSEENDYESENIAIDNFKDNIEIQILNETEEENIVAVNIDDYEKKLDCTYDSKNKIYKFIISKPGTYILLKNNFDEIEKEEKVIEEDIITDEPASEPEETSNNLLLYIGGASAVFVLLIAFLLYKTK